MGRQQQGALQHGTMSATQEAGSFEEYADQSRSRIDQAVVHSETAVDAVAAVFGKFLKVLMKGRHRVLGLGQPSRTARIAHTEGVGRFGLGGLVCFFDLLGVEDGPGQASWATRKRAKQVRFREDASLERTGIPWRRDECLRSALSRSPRMEKSHWRTKR